MSDTDINLAEAFALPDSEKLNLLLATTVAQNQKLTAIEKQTTATNGRVTKLEGFKNIIRGMVYVLSALFVLAVGGMLYEFSTVTKLEQIHKTELGK